MKPLIIRTVIQKETEHSTLSKLLVNNTPFCSVLEDGYNEVKVDGETRIPHGVYPLEERTWGGFANHYKARFGYNSMPWIRHVENFKYILQHVGNWVTNTRGCQLLGDKPYLSGGNYAIRNSVRNYKKYYETVLVPAWKAGKVYIAVDRSGSMYENHEPICEHVIQEAIERYES